MMEKKTSHFNTSMNKARNICSRQEKCVVDIQKKLSEWGVNFSDTKIIIEKLKEEKFIDETRFAKSFTRQKFFQNKWGKIKIKFHLNQKKITEKNILEAFDEINDAEYLETLYDLLLRKRQATKAKNQYQLKGKLINYALSRGFETDKIHSTLNLILKQ